ncbi:MAG: TldD/PmbA family protein [Candidatus Sericytochromatia bacterium]|nr:TldD/PmbA family protein [Candidatus Tanganyikabacteria bacterium]
MIASQAALPTRDEARRLADRVLALSGADATEVVLVGTDTRLTRFAQNQIHQNVGSRDLEIRVRAVLGNRIGVASTNDPADEALRRVVARAAEIAAVQPDNPDFRGLPDPGLAGDRGDVGGYSAGTAGYSAADRAAQVAEVCAQAAEAGLTAAGAFETGAQSLTVANSLGLFGHHAGTRAAFSTVVSGADSSGYAARLAMDADGIDIAAAGREAIEKAIRGRDPASVPAGTWTVVLEEYAVADLLAYLGYVGFGAQGYLQGASFASGRLGERLCAPSVSVWDDGMDPGGILSPFDYEGVARRRVSLIEAGVARGVVWDTFTAGREGRESTGHALPAPNPFGPFPTCLHMAPGDLDRADLAAGVERGLWITRFHYVNVMDPKATVITGMTRDGTYLIEGGRVTRPVRNLRFTEQILGALSRVAGIGRETRLLPAWFGAVRCPAVRIDGFSLQ